MNLKELKGLISMLWVDYRMSVLTTISYNLDTQHVSLSDEMCIHATTDRELEKY